MDLPKDFQDKMTGLLQEDYINYLNGFAQEYEQTLRANPLKIKPAELFRRFVLKPVSWCDTGFYYEGKERLSTHPYYYAGVYYLQEPSAMAPASFLPVFPGDKVLDLCAAPGGKTTALAGKLNGEGVLVSNDLSVSRCKALLKNVEMAGVRNAMITCETPEKLTKYFPAYFDKVLVDAPCSGEGMFRKEPSMAKSWSAEEVDRYSQVQKDILLCAAKMVCPGGYLLYSTCTYSPEENEQVIEELLKQEPDFELVELPLQKGVDSGHPEWSRSKREDLKCCRRFWNHRIKGEGQFAALLRKKEGTAGTCSLEKDKKKEEGIIGICSLEERKKEERTAGARFLEEGKKEEKRKKKKERKQNRGKDIVKNEIPEEMTEFFRHCGFSIVKERLQFVEERVFLLPEGLPDMSRLRIIRSGLYLGNCKKKRFEPSQALAMAIRPQEFDNRLSLPPDDERIEKYLRCETIEGQADDGWVLICVENFPLGWGKCSKGIIKNKYAPGWRKGSV